MSISIRHGFIARLSRILSVTDYNVQKQPKTEIGFHVVGHDAILAPTPTLHLRSTRLGGASPSIQTEYTGISHNVVYDIKCRTCKIYIGETGRRLGDRFREHLHSTRQTNTDLPVGRHFASPRHAYTDMLVSVIRSGFRDTQDRRRFDARMTFKDKTLHTGGLNTDFAILVPRGRAPFWSAQKITTSGQVQRHSGY